tara:strand:+ start:414 stop:698 length:285 start_codon:yes stop_codon:yes gene_type:complete
MLNKTVQWNTHTLSGGVPVFALNTKQGFNPQPLDNVLDQGQFDTINPNIFRGKRSHGQLEFRQYQNEQVNFSQPYHTPQNNLSWENNILWAGRG